MERGLITLDEPVYGVLPELEKLRILPTSDAALTQANLVPNKTKITLRHLLTHTSGIGYDIMHPKLMSWRKSQGEECSTLSGNLITAYSNPLVHEPGTSWTYGGNYDWAGLLVDRLTGKRLGQYFEENIFKPLGIKTCTFHLEEKPETRSKLAGMSHRGEGGALSPGGAGLADPAADDLGGVGLYSSVPDYLKVLADLIRDEPMTLKPETRDLLFTPQLDEDSPPHSDMQTMAPGFWGFFMEDTDIRVNHGLGSMLYTEAGKKSGTPRNTISWSGYSGPIWAANRDKGLAWIWATQVLPFGDAECGKRAQDFGRLVFE